MRKCMRSRPIARSGADALPFQPAAARCAPLPPLLQVAAWFAAFCHSAALLCINLLYRATVYKRPPLNSQRVKAMEENAEGVPRGTSPPSCATLSAVAKHRSAIIPVGHISLELHHELVGSNTACHPLECNCRCGAAAANNGAPAVAGGDAAGAGSRDDDGLGEGLRQGLNVPAAAP